MPTLPETPVDYKPTKAGIIRKIILNVFKPVTRKREESEELNPYGEQPHILRHSTSEEEVMEKRDKTSQRVLGGVSVKLIL